MDPQMVEGSCLCGAIRFRATLPAKWVAHCHCTMCRRAHGAAFVTWFGVEESGFRLEDPDRLYRSYGSSPGAERGFCGRCGSSFLFKSARWPGEVHLTRANVTTPMSQPPQAHAYYDTHVDWFECADALPRDGEGVA